jgi:hypothetical protein
VYVPPYAMFPVMCPSVASVYCASLPKTLLGCGLSEAMSPTNWLISDA